MYTEYVWALQLLNKHGEHNVHYQARAFCVLIEYMHEYCSYYSLVLLCLFVDNVV
jgi:hypothetical protein